MEWAFDLRLEPPACLVKAGDDGARAWGILSNAARAALEAVRPDLLMSQVLLPSSPHLLRLRLGSMTTGVPYRRLFIAALGKAAPAMASAASRQVSLPFVGIGIAPHGTVSTLPGWLWLQADHPSPTWRSVQGASAIRDALAHAGRGDVVLVLLSGGSSSLVTLPIGIELDELRALTLKLLGAGASIYELNTVRRHGDLIKAGGMARWASPARVLGLILSDVPGNPLWAIGSGPTTGEVPPTVTPAEKAGAVDDGPGPRRIPTVNRWPFPAPMNFIIASNETAIDAAVAAVREAGFHVEARKGGLRGESWKMGQQLAREALRLGATQRRHCIVLGGETTVTVRGRGVGGRNTELALAFAMAVANRGSVWLMTMTTDGVDGACPAAGAVVGPATVCHGKKLGLDPAGALRNNDSFRFLHAARATLHTGPTGTNVADIAVMLINP